MLRQADEPCALPFDAQQCIDANGIRRDRFVELVSDLSLVT
jgi:hypothetical protein